jgi:hypothetical protein
MFCTRRRTRLKFGVLAQLGYSHISSVTALRALARILALAKKKVGAVVDEILHDYRARIGQRDDEGVFCLGSAQAAMLDAHAIDDFFAFGDAIIRLPPFVGISSPTFSCSSRASRSPAAPILSAALASANNGASIAAAPSG